MIKTECCIMRLLQEGKISADEEGHIWRHWDGRNNVKRWLNPPREIKPKLRKGASYLAVSLFCDEYGKQIGVRVHRLAWMAFHGLIPPDLEMNHKDGNKLNNRLNNLELVTRQENAIHAHRTGLTNPARGERAGSAKLTAEQVLEIRRLYRETGLSTRKIAPSFGVSYHQIWAIVNRKVWRHIGG